MESTFARVGSGKSTKYLGGSSTFDRDDYAKELNDAYKSFSALNKTQNETTVHNVIASNLKFDYCRLKPHELFPGTTIDKPMPCKRLPNMPRELEGYSSSECTHYVGRSYNKVVEMIVKKEWDTLFTF